jgi:hypothetical protein
MYLRGGGGYPGCFSFLSDDGEEGAAVFTGASKSVLFFFCLFFYVLGTCYFYLMQRASEFGVSIQLAFVISYTPIVSL